MTEQRDRFQERVEALVKRVSDLVEPREWVTRTYPKKMRDPVDHEIFEVPALFLQKGPTRMLLDPVAYDMPGAEGLVDLYVMPTYDDAASLVYHRGEWMISYAAPSDPTEAPYTTTIDVLPLTEETIIQVLDSIAAHAEPSF